MSSDFGNSELNLCGANSVNNQLIFNGTSGDYNNNNRYNANRVRVSLEFEHNNASSSGCVSSSEWFGYYLIARKHKKSKSAHLKFRLNCFDNILEIKEAVNNMEYTPGISDLFVIRVPRIREIIAAAFKDRVVQTYLVERLKPEMERYVHKDSYACRTGKGNLRAAEHLQEVIFEATNGYTKDAWIYKTDFKGFFMSIDTELWVPRLCQWIDEHIAGNDKELLKYVARITYQSLPQINCNVVCHPAMLDLVPEHKKQYGKVTFNGIPIGNVSSQELVLFITTSFLNLVDSMVFGFSHYTDDDSGVVTCKDDFLALRKILADFAEKECHFCLHPSKFYFQHFSKGVEFLGYRLKYGLILPSKRLLHNFKWRITREITKAEADRKHMFRAKDKFMSTINSCCGLLKHTASFNYRKRELSRLKDSPWREIFDFDEENWLKVTIKDGYRKQDYYKHLATIRKQEIFKH